MQWFVSHQGATIGPHDGQVLHAKIQEMVAGGQSLAGAYVKDDAGAAWMPIEQSPFASALGQRNATPVGMATPTAPSKPSWFRPTKGALVGGAFLLLAILAKCGFDSVMASGRAAGEALAAKSHGAPAVKEAATPGTVVAPTAEPPARELPERASIKGSRAVFRSWFQRLGITFESSPLADGTPREMGREGLVIVEAKGFGDRLEGASLTFGLVKDNAPAALAATGAILVFMRETGWEKGGTWVTGNLDKAKGATKTMNGVIYELSPVIEGMYILSAKPVGALD